MDALLHFAIRYSNLEIIDLLVSSGISPDSISDFGSESILTAAAKRAAYDQAIVDYVATLTSNMNYINGMGFTLFDTGFGFSALGIAVCKGDAPLALHLLERGANPAIVGTACRNTVTSLLGIVP
jgi:ankyrin repeat protein